MALINYDKLEENVALFITLIIISASFCINYGYQLQYANAITLLHFNNNTRCMNTVAGNNKSLFLSLAKTFSR